MCDKERLELNELRGKEQQLLEHVESLQSQMHETGAAAEVRQQQAAALEDECNQLRAVVWVYVVVTVLYGVFMPC